MLKSHQILGYLDTGGNGSSRELWVVSCIMVSMNFMKPTKNWDVGLPLPILPVLDFHFFAPPPLIRNRVKGLNSIKAHKLLAYVHFSGMIATNAWSKEDRDWHKYAAYTTFVSYATAVLVFKF